MCVPFSNRDAWSDTLAKAFNLDQPREDEPMPTQLDWKHGMNLHAQQVKEGDCPETSVAVERWKEKFSLESMSELGLNEPRCTSRLTLPNQQCQKFLANALPILSK